MLLVEDCQCPALTSNAFSSDLSLYNLKTPKLAILEHKADRRSLKQSPIPFSLCEYIIFLQGFLSSQVEIFNQMEIVEEVL